MISATPTPSAPTTATRSMLRKLLAAAASSAPITTRVGVAPPHLASTSAAFEVFGSSKVPAGSTASEPRSACTLSAERSALRRALRLTLEM